MTNLAQLLAFDGVVAPDEFESDGKIIAYLWCSNINWFPHR